MARSQQKPLWWQEEIIYQIYPRSFQDSDGDGVGDLRGIISRLDYVQSLGVRAIWVSPIFPSPMADFGYDISDYRGIHPLFGTMDDFDLLLQEVHARGMKLLLDLVPNHSSDQHPWFLESRSSRDNPKRDWYLWADARPDGSAPNNWLAMFGGSAWEWDEQTGQYYYHGFLKEQPDLNWRNPEVQEAMLDVMRYWFGKGVDGFRIDVLWHLIKHRDLPDNPENPHFGPNQATYAQVAPLHSTDQPEVHDLVRMMREVADSYDDRLLIGEIYLPVEKLVTYYGADNKGVHLPFNFQLLNLPWEPLPLAAAIEAYEQALPANGWPNWVLGNHDQRRIRTRVGEAQARVAAMLLLTLRGTPTIYYGDEIGMRDVPIPPEEVQDPQGLNMPGLNLSRDPARTPMQWDSSPHAGFTQHQPWLRLADDFRWVNVKAQEQDPGSILALYKRLISFRQAEPALKTGSYKTIFVDRRLLAYLREGAGHRFLIVLNLSRRACLFKPPHFPFQGTVRLALTESREGRTVCNAISLAGDEGLIIQLDESPPALAS
jgi:alpha-glucosidase